MKILAIETEPGKPTSTIYNELLKEEALAVFKLQQLGILREIYFNDNHCAVIILECINTIEAELLLDELPLVKNGYIKFQITELKPYTGFTRLFKA